MSVYTGEDLHILGEFINKLGDEITLKQKVYIALKHLVYEYQQLLIEKEKQEIKGENK